MNSQKSLISFSLTILVFNKTNNKIIPKIGAGKEIFKNFNKKVQKYWIIKIIDIPFIKLIKFSFFIKQFYKKKYFCNRIFIILKDFEVLIEGL